MFPDSYSHPFYTPLLSTSCYTVTDTHSCHGPAIFPGINDAAGKSIIAGKKITGFTTQAESEMGILDALRKWDEKLVDEIAEELGATCKTSFPLHFFLIFSSLRVGWFVVYVKIRGLTLHCRCPR